MVHKLCQGANVGLQRRAQLHKMMRRVDFTPCCKGFLGEAGKACTRCCADAGELAGNTNVELWWDVGWWGMVLAVVVSCMRGGSLMERSTCDTCCAKDANLKRFCRGAGGVKSSISLSDDMAATSVFAANLFCYMKQ